MNLSPIPSFCFQNVPLQRLMASARRQTALGMGSDKLKNKLIIKDRTLPSPFKQPEIKTKKYLESVKIKSIVKCLEYIKAEITVLDQYNPNK